MKYWLHLVVCLLTFGALQPLSPAEHVRLSYGFTAGDVHTHKLSIVTERALTKAVTSSPQVSSVAQTNAQELTVEQQVKKVDQTGNAEILITFKSARMDVKVKSGAEREPQPPDTLKHLAGRSLTVFVTADGTILAVDGVVPLAASLRETVKDAGVMAIIEQDFTEEFFKEMLQNLFVQLPLDPLKAAQGWETAVELPVARTEYKLRIATQSALGRVDSEAAQIKMRGRVTASLVDPDAAAQNPTLPVVEVLSSDVAGEAVFSLARGVLLNSQRLNDLTLRTVMRVRAPNMRGNELRSEVITRTRTTTTVRLVK
jgi:hypothetical protein